MADVSTVDGDRSKIVTKFLLNTCRLLQPTERHVEAALYCTAAVSEHAEHNEKAEVIPLTTGSVAEFYIQPMLSCVGDIDIMCYSSTQLTIPAGYPPPSQLPAEFHSRVEVYEIIDSEYPGYVYLVEAYLLTENNDDDKHDVVQCARRGYVTYGFTGTHVYDHGPAMTATEGKQSVDIVRCMRCLYWPTQATDWPTRDRNYGWPDSATVHHVVSNGCDVVRVAHRLCRQHEWMSKDQWRLSFSRAEIVLLNSWMPVQQLVYHMLRFFVKSEGLTDITDSTGTKVLSNYNIKTLMLWACELKPTSWWIDDLNVVRICVVLLHTLANWLKDRDCSHYFVNTCNLLDTFSDGEIIVSRLKSITESWLSKWFVNNYLRKCAQLCPGRVSRLFDDVSTSMKLQNAVSAVVGCRLDTTLADLADVCSGTEMIIIVNVLSDHTLSLQSYDYLSSHFTSMDSFFHDYISAVTCLHVAYKTATNGLSDELIDVLATTCGQFIGKRRNCHKLSSVLSLSQAAKLMKVVVYNSRSTVQLIEIELSKAYLYRALRCKDSDSDSIYCLANVFLAVLYYTTGHYQTAIDHCTLVTRSQDHSQCSSHVVQGELLPKIDDDIDNVLGLAVFYQYVRAAALNQQQQTQHVTVFTTELFAHFLHIRCLLVMNCCHLVDEAKKMFTSIVLKEQPYITDVLCSKLVNGDDQKCHHEPQPVRRRQYLETNLTELDTSELAKLLQQSAVEHLTTYRQLQAQKFSSVVTIVTTDFEALYAYKLGDYQQCLQLSTQNVHTLLYAVRMADVLTFPEFVQLFGDDIVSLTALSLVISSEYREDRSSCSISQLTLSVYLTTQCQLKLRHSVTSLAQTLNYIEVAQRRLPVDRTLDHLTLKLTERKAMMYLSSVM